MPKKVDPLNKKQYGAVTAMLTGGRRESGGQLLSKGVRLHQTVHDEWTGREGDPCRVDAARHDADAESGIAADGCARSEGTGRFADDFVSIDGERGQGSGQGREAWRHAQGTGDGYVLGRPHGNLGRSRGLHVDGLYTHCRTHTERDATEDEGTDGADGEPASGAGGERIRAGAFGLRGTFLFTKGAAPRPKIPTRKTDAWGTRKAKAGPLGGSGAVRL